LAKLTILVEGYARDGKDYFEASPTTVLVEDCGKRVLVDPGCNKELLVAAFKKENISMSEVDYIFLTHTHLDHFLNIRLFPKLDVLDGGTIFRGDKEYSFSKFLPGTKIEVVRTPGHSFEHVALLVWTDSGVVAIAGDVFWWVDGEQKTDLKSLLTINDPYLHDSKELLKSRKLLLEKSDFIIPGHGKMFKVLKK